MVQHSQWTSTPEEQPAVATPSIIFPKGGGAIRGIGEKFAANPVTGTGSMSVPIATSPGRSGFGPQLSLSYDSGAGNSPFGFGWNLSLPAITRKTDKGLPSYRDVTGDVQDDDVFLLSGAEDLVPVYRQDLDGSWVAAHPGHQRDENGSWIRDGSGRLVIHEDDIDGFRVRRYRPRIEGLFARIERWTSLGAPDDIHWRSITGDNLLTVYGGNERSRVQDPLHPGHVFSWLISETRDDKGNAIFYEYKYEDGAGVMLSAAHERNRGDPDDPQRTANRYLKRIRYGNRRPLLDGRGRRPRQLSQQAIDDAGWMFEVVFDYGEHNITAPTPTDTAPWDHRPDPFSSYRAGFEVRTTRLCRRVLLFHHFPEDESVGADCLVRSTDFTYSQDLPPEDAHQSAYSFLAVVNQSSYRRDGDGYQKRSLPPVEFGYSRPRVGEHIETVDPQTLTHLPIGIDGDLYQWIDLHGEGLPGVVTEQGGTWFYQRNLSPITPYPGGKTGQVQARFGALEQVALKPNMASTSGGHFMDLAGDGETDLVLLDGPTPGLFEHDGNEGWKPFQPFTARLNGDFANPNLRLVDLDGDGHADVLITEDNAFVWHASLAEAGFGSAQRAVQALDEEYGPRLVFADGTQSIHLADMSGDGLTDLARIRNGEVCYWPNLGYGRFGAKITMDLAPLFDHPEQFDQQRIRLADIDGTGTTDILYLHRDGVRLYFNQSGNAWSTPAVVPVFPRVDGLVRITPLDLLGNGTTCLVWSSPLPGDTGQQLRYVELMTEGKPHLLIRSANNLGAETRIHYAPSTQFYLKDRLDGQPWITRLPFPVHVVERVETLDHISHNRFVTRYAYHHGYFDGEEREFRGFGMVEKWDTEEIGAFVPGGEEEEASNWGTAFQMPPVHTKTWLHTGAWLNRDSLSRQFEAEYYREPGLTDDEFRALLLPDTYLPDGLTLEEEREACRALKGQMLRQEVYTDDAPLDASEEVKKRARTPYSVAEQDFTIRPLQPRADNRHAVFFTHPREVITYHYERNPIDPRIQHALTLEVDDYGNVLKEAAIGYGRHETIRMMDKHGNEEEVSNPALAELLENDQAKQTTPLLTYTENRVTNTIDTPHTWRTPLPCEALTFELTGYPATGAAGRYRAGDFVESDSAQPGRLRHRFTDQVTYETGPTGYRCRRPIEWLRTRYRPDDCGVTKNNAMALLPLGTLESLALSGESYQLAFTPGLLDWAFRRDDTPLLPYPALVLEGHGAEQGGYIDLNGNGHWWTPSGRAFFSPDPTASPEAELTEARQHFFLPRRYHDPFGQQSVVTFDDHDLLMVETRDALSNRVTVDANDYRVLQPRLVSDPNRNQSEVAFDTLGLVVGTAVMGKSGEGLGDSLAGFVPEPTDAQREAFLDAPRQASASHPNTGEATTVVHELLAGATTRIVYDLDHFMRTGEPLFAATIARETHLSDLPAGQPSQVQVSFSYSDGFGREIQQKVQAEPGPLVAGGPVINPRWISSGWTIFNNKAKPVRQYEPFFSDTQRFEFNAQHGVSPVLFYDPLERVIATLHPNHTYEKVVFDPWRQTTWDVNDTCAPRHQQTGDPRTDPDIGGSVAAYFKTQPDDWQTWQAQRSSGALGTHEQTAAARAAVHADTPTTTHFDTLGRPFLTIAHNRVACEGHELDGTDERFATRVVLDIEGNQREVRDERRLPGAGHLPKGAIEQRTVMRYAYDLLGNHIHQASMEAGERWMLGDVAGNPIRAWDSRGHDFTSAYDTLRRPIAQTVHGTTSESDPRALGRTLVTDRIEYGESLVNADALNLRTRVYRQCDNAGIVTNARLDANGEPIKAYDFKGNLRYSTRRLISGYKDIPDWAQPPPLEAEAFAASTRFDALNRSIQSIAPHSRPDRLDVIQPVFNEANLLERLDVWLERSTEPPRLLNPTIEAPSPVGVVNINYDAKGQRTLIDYKTENATVIRTTYTYDRETFRLTHLYTRRGVNPETAQGGAFPDDCDNPNPPPATIAAPARPLAGTACGLQNLHYTYDPAGNITRLQDDAQQTIFFKNQRVEPSNDYTYDALYRLIEAKGREHLGQNGQPIPHSPDDELRVGLPHPGDSHAMGTYTERYIYDAVGNFLQMQHRGSVAGHDWTRAYAYSEASLTEDGSDGLPPKVSNRLSQTVLHPNSNSPMVEPYSYDAHGNMASMPHLPLMQWDYSDQLRASSRQVRNNGGIPEITWYVYDASGQRVRKITESPAAAGNTPTRRKERLYLGGLEVYREYEHDGETVTLERESLHLMDDRQRIALVETCTQGSNPAPRQLIRYQHGNHLGSASLELDAQARILSYEEYSPYGSTTYQAVRTHTETPKRYRYTGMERDEETGLNYHTARYYAPWLGLWGSCDPIDLKGGMNILAYSHNNPIHLVDFYGLQPQGKETTYIPIEAGKHPLAVLAESPFNEAWEQALEQRYKGGSLRKNLEIYQKRLADATDKETFGDTEYSKVQKIFRRIVRGNEQLSAAYYPDTQLHHIEPKKMKPVQNSQRAVDPNNLLITRGNARSKGTSHHTAQYGPGEQRRQQWEITRRQRAESGGSLAPKQQTKPPAPKTSTTSGAGFMSGLLDIYTLARNLKVISEGADPLETLWAIPRLGPTEKEFLESEDATVGQEIELLPKTSDLLRGIKVFGRGVVEQTQEGRKIIRWVDRYDEI
ncbi:SpvB/TcaC N-terminal domain-containing protein [Vreelandella rituensis]|uniref:Toxin n=1 Tax=Vreelandella rituensis TaxID=2282306 RepID=A0A368TRX8_9GAMM|nr:SpvB/TcaC N-terminal domain-containing protein [Halomonas rituensis]RCV87414.1 toxin [Halomonas rituensis]